MSKPVSPTTNRPPYDYSGGGRSGPSDKNLKKIVGMALMAVGGIFTLYGAGSGLSTLVKVTLDHFGLLCLAGIINFVFWSCFLTPLGGLLANGVCVAGGVMLFGGLPAIPGTLIASGGAYVYFTV